jgi:putative hemolysin
LLELAGLPRIPAFEPYRRTQRSLEGFGLENRLAEMHVKLRIDPLDMSRIPATGSVVVVANHPSGMLDGVALAALLTRVRPDVKVMTNYLVRDIPELARHCIFIDSLHRPGNFLLGKSPIRRGMIPRSV